MVKEPEKYIADTVDLTRDDDARVYWLHCFQESLPKFTGINNKLEEIKQEDFSVNIKKAEQLLNKNHN